MYYNYQVIPAFLNMSSLLLACSAVFFSSTYFCYYMYVISVPMNINCNTLLLKKAIIYKIT